MLELKGTEGLFVRLLSRRVTVAEDTARGEKKQTLNINSNCQKKFLHLLGVNVKFTTTAFQHFRGLCNDFSLMTVHFFNLYHGF